MTASSISAEPLVLLVEDDSLVRLVAAEVLADVGCTVVEVENAAEALAYLGRGNVPDVLVTDVRMPGPIDGLALANIVATRWPQIGIVVCSAHAFPAADELPAGAVFLSKPHAPGTMVRHVVALSQIRRLAATDV